MVTTITAYVPAIAKSKRATSLNAARLRAAQTAQVAKARSRTRKAGGRAKS